MFENFKLKRQIKKLNMEYEQSILNYSINTMSLLEKTANIVQPEKDEADWVLHGSDTSGRPTEDEHATMLEQSYKLWRQELHARAIVRTMVKFVIGKGATVRPKAENEKVKQVWEDFKTEGKTLPKKRKWNLKEKEIFRRLFRDGEVIIRLFKSKEGDGLVRTRFIRPDRVRTPTNLKKNTKTGLYNGEKVTYGIGHNPEDIEDYKTYYICDDKGNLKAEVPAEDILHYKIFADSDMKRGISLLEICAPMLKKYGGWLEDRIVLNKVRNAIALIKTVDAPTSKIQAIRDNLESETRDADRKKLKMPERGTVITTSPGIKWEMLSPNLNATDAVKDGRNMLLSIAAGVGFPEMILTADYSNANYSSTMIAQNPFVREIEDWQDYATTIYQDIFAAVIQNAIDNGPLPAGTSTECEVEFQPLIHQDLDKEDRAMEIEYRNGVISRTTWQLKRGLDPDTEKANRETEKGDEVYPPEGPSGGFPGGEPPEGEERIAKSTFGEESVGSGEGGIVEVAQVIPEVVHRTTEGMMSILKGQSGLLTEAISEAFKNLKFVFNNPVHIEPTKVNVEQPKVEIHNDYPRGPKITTKKVSRGKDGLISEIEETAES